MLTFGTPPYIECSMHGGWRFCAFNARPSILKGKSIMQAYQAMKILSDGTTGNRWEEAIHKPAINQVECYEFLRNAWASWVDEYHLMSLLVEATGLSDTFGSPSGVSSASILWDLRNEYLQYLNDHGGV